MEYDSFEHNCYNLYTIKTNKFNTNRIEVVFKMKCTKENITFSALLFDVLIKTNNKYKTEKELARALEDAYDANMYTSITRVGEALIISAVTEVLSNKLDPKLTKNAIDMLFESIFNPCFFNGTFSFKVIEEAKRNLFNEIKSISEDIKQTSILEALQSLDDQSPRGLSITGDADILNNITPTKISVFYKNLMNESSKDIYVLGNINPVEIDQYIFEKNKFNSIPITNMQIYLPEIKTRKTTRLVGNITKQINYVEVYALYNLNDFERDYIVVIFNAIWGSGSLESRLYKALRKDKGLCYNVNAYYQKYDKCLILHTNVDSKRIKETAKTIRSTLLDIIKNGVTDDELISAKKMIINSLSLINDSPTKIIDNYLFWNMKLLEDADERKDNFNKVTSNDIKELAKKIKLKVTYIRGEIDEEIKNK